MYFRQLSKDLVLTNTSADHASTLELMQREIFPTLSEAEIMLEKHFKRYVEVFQPGQFVVLSGDKIAGSTSTMRCQFDFEHPNHTFLEFTDNLSISTHDENGAWLYGLDVMVSLDFRKQGIARSLYQARQEYVQQHGMLGQITSGMLNGYYPFRDEMSPESYFQKLKVGEIYDPTVSTQQKIGWELLQLIPNYLDDPQCGNYGVLMVLKAEKEV